MIESFNPYIAIEYQSLQLTLAEAAMYAHLVAVNEDVPETVRTPRETLPEPTSRTVPAKRHAA